MITKEEILNCIDKIIAYYKDQMKEDTVLKSIYIWPMVDCKNFKEGIEKTELPIEKIISAVSVFEFWIKTKYHTVVEHFDKTLNLFMTYEEKEMSEELKNIFMDIGNELYSISFDLNHIETRPFIELMELNSRQSKENIKSIEKAAKKWEGKKSDEFCEMYVRYIKNSDPDDLPVIELGANSRNSVKYFEEIMGREFPELHVSGKPMAWLTPKVDENGIGYDGVPYEDLFKE